METSENTINAKKERLIQAYSELIFELKGKISGHENSIFKLKEAVRMNPDNLVLAIIEFIQDNSHTIAYHEKELKEKRKAFAKLTGDDSHDELVKEDIYDI